MEFNKHFNQLIALSAFCFVFFLSRCCGDTAFSKSFCEKVSLFRNSYNDFCASNHKLYEQYEGPKGYLYHKICNSEQDSSQGNCRNIDPINVIYGMDGILFNKFMVFQRYVKDSAIASIMLECIGINDKNGARQAAEYCCQYLHPDLLEKYSDKIQQKLQYKIFTVFSHQQN
jgi:hypothetical protein